jgi:BirA family biotin operon repressor/biotin-[acetyl-CoA-carboxylase] ligase
MDLARERVLTGKMVGAGIAAREQTAGRGQRGRAWFAKPGESLCVTYYLQGPGVTPERAAHIGLLSGLAVAQTIQRLFPLERSSEIGLKWPNDVVINGKKVAGILIEMVREPADGWVALVGVGMNITVRDLPEELAARATSLVLEGIEPPGWQDLAVEIAGTLSRCAEMWQTVGLDTLIEAWKQLDNSSGRRYRLDHEGVSVIGIAVGIDASGALMLQLPSGELVSSSSATSVKEEE